MITANTIINDLRTGKRKIAVWGLGYIGYSTISYYAKNGLKAIGYDMDNKKVANLNKGQINIPNIEYWLGFDVGPLVKSGMMRATNDWEKLISKDVAVHFVCVPTERNALPYDLALQDVIKKISSFHKIKTDFPPLVIIESTISADRIEKIIIPELKRTKLRLWTDILLAVAPRRDWFVSAEKSVITIPRVVGGVNNAATTLAAEVLGIVSQVVLKASDCIHAALVKSVENTYRQVGITLANQLSLAFPEVNIKEVLNLVGTKWNIDTYHPSFGIGGYCIPLAPHYVINGAAHPDELTIIKESINSAMTMPKHVADAVIKSRAKKVGILGLAYKGNLKVDILSPTKDIVVSLKDRGIKVKVHDPYYNAKEIMHKCGVETFDFPKGMNEFEIILLVADHSLYKYTAVVDITSNLKNCCSILDNVGFWKGIKWSKNIVYHEAGGRNWLKI